YRSAFPAGNVNVLTAMNGTEGVEQFARHHPDAVLLNIHLPDQSGLEIFRTLQGLDAGIPIICVASAGSTNHAIKAMASGAFDFVHKPVRVELLRDLVQRAFTVSHSRQLPDTYELAGSQENPDALVGTCQAMQEVYKAVGRAAPQDVTVLILGESGTGKEIVARAIYHYSHRDKGPFQ